MSTQIESSNVNAHRSRWKALSDWYTAFEEGMNFDPNEYAINSIQVLSQQVAQLEARVIELESQASTNVGQ